MSDARGILDVFTQVQYFNGPIWFLLALFWCNIAFCFISLNVRNEVIRAFLVLALFAVGYTVEKMGVFVPCMLDAAMVGMPFFALMDALGLVVVRPHRAPTVESTR